MVNTYTTGLSYRKLAWRRPRPNTLHPNQTKNCPSALKWICSKSWQPWMLENDNNYHWWSSYYQAQNESTFFTHSVSQPPEEVCVALPTFSPSWAHRRSSGLVTCPESTSTWWGQDSNPGNPKTLNSVGRNFIAILLLSLQKERDWNTQNLLHWDTD